MSIVHFEDQGAMFKKPFRFLPYCPKCNAELSPKETPCHKCREVIAWIDPYGDEPAESAPAPREEDAQRHIERLEIDLSDARENLRDLRAQLATEQKKCVLYPFGRGYNAGLFQAQEEFKAQLAAERERAEAYRKQDIERLREGQRLIDREKARAEKAEGEAKALSKLVRELIPTAVNWHQRLHDKAGIEAVMLDNLIEDARAAIREGKPVDLIATKNGKDY